jgi:hypothetical protein
MVKIKITTAQFNINRWVIGDSEYVVKTKIGAFLSEAIQFFGSNQLYQITSFKLSVVDHNEHHTLLIVDCIDSSHVDVITQSILTRLDQSNIIITNIRRVFISINVEKRT